MTHRIIIPDDFPRAISGTKAEDKVKTLGEVQIYLDKAKTQEELIERIKEAEVVINIRAYTHLNAEVLASLSKSEVDIDLGNWNGQCGLGISAETGNHRNQHTRSECLICGRAHHCNPSFPCSSDSSSGPGSPLRELAQGRNGSAQWQGVGPFRIGSDWETCREDGKRSGYGCDRMDFSSISRTGKGKRCSICLKRRVAGEAPTW